MPTGLPSTPTQRILDASPLVPQHGALAGWAAAYVLGVDPLDGLDPFTMDPLPLTVNLGSTAGRVNPAGVSYVRDRLPASHRVVRHGVSVTGPMRTAFDGARWAPNLVEAVVFLDQVARALDLDLNELTGWAEPGGWWQGVVRLREALTWADARSASSWRRVCGCSTSSRLACRIPR